MKQYDDDDFSLIAGIPEHSGCYSSQGMAVGEKYIYAAQINGNETAATITRVDMETGETAQMWSADGGAWYFDFLGHANDMDAFTVDGVEYLSVRTLSGSVIILEVRDTELISRGKYITKRGSEKITTGNLSVKSVVGSVVTFQCLKNGNVLEGTLDLDAETNEIKLGFKGSVNVSAPIIDGTPRSFPGWSSQGIGVVGDMVLVIYTGNNAEATINHSVIFGYDLSKGIRLSTPDIAFYLTSDVYCGLFEIEDCDVGPDGRLYFNINGRREMNGNSSDGVLVLDGYTFTDREPLVSYRFPTVTAEAGYGGKISPVGYTKVKAGDDLRYTIMPSRGYIIDKITVDGSKVETSNTYTFSSVLKNHTIKVTFKAVSWKNPFTDVTENDWFRDDVEYVNLQGIMRGTQDTVFSPEMTLTRAQMVTMLWRLAGEPAAAGASFADVPGGQWYSDAVAWAASKKIVEGYDDGNFYPDNALTREQAVAILHRYAGGAEVSGYTTVYHSSEWARGSVSWAADQGLLSGIGTDMTDMIRAANRAEVAALLTRFCLKTVG